MKKFFQSLLAKYMLIIFMALFLLHISFFATGIFVLGLAENKNNQNSTLGVENYDEIEKKWHAEAQQLNNVSGNQIYRHFEKWNQQYPEASMFWVDKNGILTKKLKLKEELPDKWTPAFTAKFIKERYGASPFTVIAFVGENEEDGFIVIEIPRETFQPPLQKVYDRYGTILVIGTVLIIFAFILISFLFFWNIRKRLLHLQEAMTTRDLDGLPIQTEVKKNDEVGHLEQAFNEMVQELRQSKRKEQEEEQLRRELIANLSHDLRTPLTKIRAQVYSLENESLTKAGKDTLQALESSVIATDRLIENLMSYTLLMSNKYQFEPKEIDVVRYVRECLAAWYPVFEREGFQFEAKLQSFEEGKWTIDPTWLDRIFDNLLQNILRHAKSGKYICVKTESTKLYDAFVIMDLGKGMESESNEKGAGIGLSIVDMMIQGMGLDWEIGTNKAGTTIKIKKYK